MVIAGPPEKIADHIGDTGSRAAPPTASTSCRRGCRAGSTIFVEQVVPILRKRGLFREEYTGKTLRNHYGLTRPAGIYSNAIQAIA